MKMKRLCLLCSGILIPVLILLTGGCQTTQITNTHEAFRQSSLSLSDKSDTGIVSVFLSLEKPESPHIIANLYSVELKGDGDWTSLDQEIKVIDSKNIGEDQIFIGRNVVPASSYSKIRLTFDRASLIRDQSASLSLPGKTVELVLPTTLKLKKGDSRCLFITWDVENSIEKMILFKPKMKAAIESVPIINNLLFAACPEIDTVYIIRTDTNRVTASIGISGKPTYLGLEPLNRKLHVLASDESAIKVVDLTINQIVDKIFLTSDNKPDFMTLDEDGQKAYVLDRLGNSIVLIDLITGTIIQRATINYNPVYAVYLKDEDKLAVSLNRSNTVNLLNPVTLNSNTNISTGNSPLGLAENDGILYMAESGNNSVLAYNLREQKIGSQIVVGFVPTRILAAKNLIYVANSVSRSISVVSPQIFQVVREVPLGNTIIEMAASINYNWLYAGNSDTGGIAVIDMNSNRIDSFIDLAAAPRGMAVLE